LLVLALAVLLAVATAAVRAEDWPTYQHDNARSGVTSERLKPPLSEKWRFVPIHPPTPAWGNPQPKPVEGNLELPRMRFDDAFHVAVADHTLFFGSSSEHVVYALDTESGEMRWTFVTGGPVRLAPSAWNGKVFFGSDDGYAYCVEAEDGSVVWKFRAAPTDERALGHGKVISLWPLRTSILVDGKSGVAYFGAGVFPAEGLYLYAVRAENGKLLWRNGTLGWIDGRGLSPQGYLLASADKLFIPSGRAMPAAFDRSDGRFLHHPSLSWRLDGLFGGTYALLADNHVYGGTEQIVTYSQETGKAGFAWFNGRRLIVTRDVSYMLTDTEISALDRRTYPAASRQRQELRRKRYKLTQEERTIKRAFKPLRDHAKKLRADIDDLERELEVLRKEGKTDTDEFKGLARHRDLLAGQLDENAAKLEALDKQKAELKKKFEALSREEKKVAALMRPTIKWRCQCDCPDSMILAGHTAEGGGVLFAGGTDKVVAVDAATGERLWTGKVDGKAKGLAVADGRLFVSTDRGIIYCFAQAGQPSRIRKSGLGRALARAIAAESPKRLTPRVNLEPFGRDDATAFYRSVARSIVAETGIKRGYCLLLGGGAGRLALELAKSTDLIIYMVEPDARNVETAIKAMKVAGLFGARVCVEQGPLTKLPYPDYFANLVICEETFRSARVTTPAEELLRVLKPLGGVACVGRPPSAPGDAAPLRPDVLQDWLKPLRRQNVEIVLKGSWARITRGRLEGAGGWTHQYAEPGNTTCSDDKLVKCPLGILWFGEPGPGRMPSRHASAAAPLSVNGRLFVQGENVVMAYDAYNGLLLWQRDIPGAIRLGIKHGECSNLAASEDSLFVAVGLKCLRLDAATGKTRRTYVPPPDKDGKPCKWGYVARVGGTLFGSRTKGMYVSEGLFAVDVDAGKLRWTFDGKEIRHNTIAVGDGRIFFVDKDVTPAQREEALADRIQQVKRLKGAEAFQAKRALAKADVRRVAALDTGTGKLLWQKPLDVSDCIKIGAGGGELAAIYKNGILLLCSNPRNGHFWKEFFAGEFSGRSIIALSAEDGKLLWAGRLGYRSRPLVIGDTIYAEPWAYDLRTGAPRMRVHPLTRREEKWQVSRPGHHCGCMAACPNALFFRSSTIAYYDLIGDYGTLHFGSQRPGCWINFIPANGLVLIPEASSGCVCPYPIQCTVVLHPRKMNRAWGAFSAPGPLTPVKHLAVNLGAPGDRKDDEGTFWLSYPRPARGRLVLELPIEVQMTDGGGYYRRNPDVTSIAGTRTPWIFTSGCSGLVSCAIPLVGDGEAPAAYTVRLLFCEPTHGSPGRRVFDVKLQGRVVLKDFDVVKESGACNKALVKEFTGVQVNDRLKIELVSKVAEPSVEQAPILNGIEILR